MPAIRQRAASGSSSFSNALKRSQISSGNVDLDEIFEAAGKKFNISPDLLKAVAKVESNFRPEVVSRAGAMGIMQLMPGTAKYLGVTDPFDPEQNIMGGAKYLKEQLDRFDGDVKLALAAYNAGWPTVIKHGGIPPFRQTQNYVPKVLGYLGGDELTAGMTTYNGFDVSDKVKESPASGSFDFIETLSQMMFVKIIEMQMNSSNDDKKKVF